MEASCEWSPKTAQLRLRKRSRVSCMSFRAQSTWAPTSLPVSLDDVASDDHRFDISWSGPEHHDRHGVAEPIEMGGAHVDDGDVGLLARGEAADLVVKIPYPRAVEGGQSKHVPLV